MSCLNCFNVKLPECLDNIVIKGSLTPSIEYFYTITDHFGERFSDSATTDISGLLTIDTSLVPVGSFNRHAGCFTLELFSSENNCDRVLPQFCCDGTMVSYDCITFSFYQTTDTTTSATIGCDC